jgi:hypothetical protein
MPVFLFGIGVFAFVAGLVMIGFGIPINEFSFGNTLISAGTTASVGGLVIIAVGTAVGQLRRIAGMLADPANARVPLPLDELEPAAARKGAGLGPAVAPAIPPAPGRGPQRPKERSLERSSERPIDREVPDPFAIEPEPAPFGERADQSFAAPSLRNPDEAALAVDDDISLSPRHPQGAPAPAAMPPGSLDRTSDSFDWRVPPPAPSPSALGAPGAQGAPPPRPQPANFDANPAARSQPGNFDAMWPAESKAAKAPSSGAPGAAPKPEPKLEPKPDALKRAEPEKPRTVAILKSGVVDGMGYTLYVDGSIEAELPQGTLRFASINELRSHLEKNS